MPAERPQQLLGYMRAEGVEAGQQNIDQPLSSAFLSSVSDGKDERVEQLHKPCDSRIELFFVGDVPRDAAYCRVNFPLQGRASGCSESTLHRKRRSRTEESSAIFSSTRAIPCSGSGLLLQRRAPDQSRSFAGGYREEDKEPRRISAP